MILADLGWALTTGLAGSLHCFGMCGPLVIAHSLRAGKTMQYGADNETSPVFPGGIISHHLAFHAGRIGAYAITASVAAGIVHLAGSVASFQNVRNVLSIGAGCLMVVAGLALLKVIILPSVGSLWIFGPGRRNSRLRIPTVQSLPERVLAGLLKSQGGVSKGVLGFAAGFLPCMLSWAMIVKAAETGDVLIGFLVMAFFGLGTVPALLFTGFFASFFTLRMRIAGERLAGLSVLIMGFILAWKGVSRFV